MNAVLDTNVLVSALLDGEGVCGHILRLWWAGVFTVYVDVRVLREYEDVLPRARFRLRPDEVREALRLIRLKARHLVPPPVEASLPDATDLPFLEIAAAANAVLVTGNTRHFPARSRAGVAVMTPREFLDALRGSS